MCLKLAALARTGGERLGGFVLPLLEMMADQLDFCRTDPQGTTVRAEKLLRYETQEALDHADDMDNADGGGKLLSAEADKIDEI